VLRDWIDAMPNEQYQSLFGLPTDELRARFLDGAPAEVAHFIAAIDDAELAPLVTDLGGHDMAALLTAFAEADAIADRPTVVFAYTVKGWGLPIAGHPRNHSALLSADQITELRARTGLTVADEWDRFDPGSPAGILCNSRREALHRPPREPGLAIEVPDATGISSSRPLSTQEAFGRVLVDLSRHTELARHLVTTAPDVATSTNLAGFINRTGVYAPTERRAWNADPVLKWAEGPRGQHIELGISEMNLFLLLGQLGLSWDLSEQHLLPIGTVYDPFVCRGLDAFIYATYSGARFIIAGTPSGVTLAPEGGAHQSTITASIGMELPGVTFIEPAYATALDWLLCDAVGRMASTPVARPGDADDDGAYYFRLTTRPLDQAPFEAARSRLGDALLRRQVLAGAYRLVEADAGQGAPQVHLVATGAVVPEVLAAAAELAEEGIAAHVVDVTSADRLYAAWQRTLRQGLRTATTPSIPGALRAAFPDRAPIVTVHDASSHALAWLGSAMGMPQVPVGVDGFGQSGSVAELYEANDLTPGAIVNAALAALALG
jgi:pyruvate dehydrogenase E1 component